VTQLKPEDYVNDTFKFVWVSGGSERLADVYVDGVNPSVWFDVRRPLDQVTAVANQNTIPDLGKKGVNPNIQPDGLSGRVLFGYDDVSNEEGQNGMEFTSPIWMWPNEWNGFQACFCQVINSVHFEKRAANGELQAYEDHYNKLDGEVFRYSEGTSNGFSAWDSPAKIIPDPLDYANDEVLIASYSFSMWHMCKPTSGDSIWIPLNRVDWTLNWTVKLDIQLGKFKITEASHNPDISMVAIDTNIFPKWDGIYA
jgi:hypothetical protein